MTGTDPAPRFDEHRVRRLLEGDGTAFSALARAVLYLPGKAYGMIMAARRLAYNTGIYKSFPAGLPTISVGNITAGGSGKTPTVALLAKKLLDLGHRPAILMRGYARTPGGESDEAALYKALVPQAILAVNPNRKAGADYARNHDATILLMDDGFQHRRLKRDLDIVLIDATSPWGGGNTLPGGLLREPKTALKAAGTIIVTRADQVTPQFLGRLMKEIAHLAPGVPVHTARHKPARLMTLDNTIQPLESLKGRNVVALAGIARPEAFVATLAQLGANTIAVFAKPDHDPMDGDFIRNAARTAETANALTVTTEKDYAKPVFQKLGKETTDNINSNLLKEGTGEAALRSIRILGVDQDLDEMDSLMEKIRKLAPAPVTPERVK